MTLDQALREWTSKNRRMGCVAATHWLTSRVPGWRAERLIFFTPEGERYDHVVASNGFVRVDLAPYACRPRD